MNKLSIDIRHFVLLLLKIMPKLGMILSSYYNRLLFWVCGVKVGRNASIMGKVYLQLENGAEMTIGDCFILSSGNGINPISRNLRAAIYASEGARITIGNNVGMSSPCIWAKESITICDGVNIGAGCTILDTDCHNMDWCVRAARETTPEGLSVDSSTAKSAPVLICENAWIGAGVTILKGVTIGARSIIAAGSVVTKSIPDDCVAGGTPAKVLRIMRLKI